MVHLQRLEERQFLPHASLEDVWDFFANPRNLAVVSPPDLGLRLSSDPPARAYPGLIVVYRLELLRGLRLTWVTEVTHIREGRLLVDEQRFGPFRFWHHERHLTPHDSGVEVLDRVYYALPLGPVGWLVNALLVRRRIERVFGFRRRVLAQRFGAARLPTD